MTEMPNYSEETADEKEVIRSCVDHLKTIIMLERARGLKFSFNNHTGHIVIPRGSSLGPNTNIIQGIIANHSSSLPSGNSFNFQDFYADLLGKFEKKVEMIVAQELGLDNI